MLRRSQICMQFGLCIWLLHIVSVCTQLALVVGVPSVDVAGRSGAPCTFGVDDTDKELNGLGICLGNMQTMA